MGEQLLFLNLDENEKSPMLLLFFSPVVEKYVLLISGNSLYVSSVVDFCTLGAVFEQFHPFPFIPLAASHLDVTNCAQVTSRSR